MSNVRAHSQDDLRMLRGSVRTLFERAGGIARARNARDKGWDRQVMNELAHAGVLGVAAPEAVGGLGMGLTAAGVIVEEVGRALTPEPVVSAIALAIGMIQRVCPGDAMLATAISGKIACALAWQERGLRGYSDQMACRFDGKVLNGSKAWIAGAVGADQLLVVAQNDSKPVLVALDADGKGIYSELRRQSDGSQLCDIDFVDAPAKVLAEGSVVSEALSGVVADATALAAAELVGVSAKALELTLDYVKTREQFGKPIGSFQVIQHRAVDLYVSQQVAEAGVSEALARMHVFTDPRARAREASRAKARACSTAKKITRESIQLHGAVGYADEFDIGLFLNRALVLSAWLGDAAYHRAQWMDALEAKAG